VQRTSPGRGGHFASCRPEGVDMMEQPRDRAHELDDERRGAGDRSVGDEPVKSEPGESAPVGSEPAEAEPAGAGPGGAAAAGPVVDSADREVMREEEGALVGAGAGQQVTAPAEHDGSRAAAAPSGPRSDIVEEPFELFSISDVEGYRRRWDVLQAGFVDDPPAAAQQAEMLVSELMQRMTDRHATLRKGLGGGPGEAPDPEALRPTLRRD